MGPSGLSRSQSFREAVFPDRSLNMLDTAAMFGIMYCIFLIGVRTDLSLLRKVGRKAVIIGLPSVIVPYVLVVTLAYRLSGYLSDALKNILFQSFVGATLGCTSFPVLVPILSEFNVLNSELGRIATSSAIMSDSIGYGFICSFILLNASMSSSIMALWAAFALILIIVFIFFVVRPIALWVIRTTPQNKEVEEKYIFAILVIVAIVGFFSDMIGANSFNGALVVGIAIPDGPPLGSAVVQKLDCFVTDVLMPLYFVMSGLKTDVFAIQNATSWSMLQFLMFLGFAGKFVGTIIPSLWMKMPLRDAASLSLIMCVKGVVELLTYNYWFDVKVPNITFLPSLFPFPFAQLTMHVLDLRASWYIDVQKLEDKN